MRVYIGEDLARYGFPDHPFGEDRHAAFVSALETSPRHGDLTVCDPVEGDTQDVKTFHTPGHLDRVCELSALGHGRLDPDTPAHAGLYEAALTVTGTVIAAVDAIMAGPDPRAFVPIAGLHHAHPDRSSGFCVFNDCALAILRLRGEHGLRRIAYVDIDAHHGDGVFYAFEDDPDVVIADIHQDGRTIFPGTGHMHETGAGPAVGTKLNLPLPPGADDEAFAEAWRHAAAFLREAEPEFVILQCGADGLAGDMIAALSLSPNSHALAARDLRAIADDCAGGRILALGGGGYNHDNIGAAWTAVVEALVQEPE